MKKRLMFWILLPVFSWHFGGAPKWRGDYFQTINLVLYVKKTAVISDLRRIEFRCSLNYFLQGILGIAMDSYVVVSNSVHTPSCSIGIKSYYGIEFAVGRNFGVQ